MRRRTAWWVILPAACLGLLSASGTLAQESNAERIENTRTALEKWVETRRIISQEKRDWEVGREVLQSRIELVGDEIEELREKIADAEEQIAEADVKRQELLEENERLKAASEALDGAVLTLERRTTELLRRLPEPIRDRVKPLSQRFPEDPENTELSLAERFQNIVGVLNEVNKFNREITMTSELRALPDGSQAEVQTVYIGIGRGYYTNNRGDRAGIGYSTPDGWVWEPADEAAPAIAKVIAILKDEEAAAFVRLPVDVE